MLLNNDALPNGLPWQSLEEFGANGSGASVGGHDFAHNLGVSNRGPRDFLSGQSGGLGLGFHSIHFNHILIFVLGVLPASVVLDYAIHMRKALKNAYKATPWASLHKG